ncbi:MAG: hypothetical protein PHU51_01105 [Candidatus Nanoarchaeia archaeon]|nr:hypothetical protein [Candidatus Nanoarchaeia archaeon]
MKDKEIKEYIEKKYLRINTIFEIIGHPKEHVESTMKAYVENIKKDSEIVVLKEEYEPAEELEGGVFGVIAEIEMLVKNIEKLTWLCVNFSPASIELIEPDEVVIEQKEITHWLNDLLAKLHEIGVAQKKIHSDNEGLIRNFNAMTRNAILLVLKEPCDIQSISKKIGMEDKHTELFVEKLIKEKKIVKEKNVYHLIR